MRRTVIVLALAFVTYPAVSQSKVAGSKASSQQLETQLRTCQAENAELQKKLNELLTLQLEAMKKTTDAESGALAAIRALDSVADSANLESFQRYFLDAKVKVDGLPEGPRKTELTGVVSAYGDVLDAWRNKIKEQGTLLPEDMSRWESRYPGITQSVRSWINRNGFLNYSAQEVVEYILKAARSRLVAATATK